MKHLFLSVSLFDNISVVAEVLAPALIVAGSITVWNKFFRVLQFVNVSLYACKHNYDTRKTSSMG